MKLPTSWSADIGFVTLPCQPGCVPSTQSSQTTSALGLPLAWLWVDVCLPTPAGHINLLLTSLVASLRATCPGPSPCCPSLTPWATQEAPPCFNVGLPSAVSHRRICRKLCTGKLGIAMKVLGGVALFWAIFILGYVTGYYVHKCK